MDRNVTSNVTLHLFLHLISTKMNTAASYGIVLFDLTHSRYPNTGSFLLFSNVAYVLLATADVTEPLRDPETCVCRIIAQLVASGRWDNATKQPLYELRHHNLSKTYICKQHLHATYLHGDGTCTCARLQKQIRAEHKLWHLISCRYHRYFYLTCIHGGCFPAAILGMYTLMSNKQYYDALGTTGTIANTEGINSEWQSIFGNICNSLLFINTKIILK